MGIFLWSGFSEAAAAADLNVELTYRVHSAQANQLADDYDDGAAVECSVLALLKPVPCITWP